MKKAVEGPFRSEEGRALYLAAYEHTLSHWPSGWSSSYVDTEEGTTHILSMGREDAPPLVLLHGFRVSSTMWGANIGALSQSFRVYCLDTLGDWGRSSTKRPTMFHDDLLVWLEHVREALGLTSFFLGGMSYGGLLTLRYAAKYPERVKRIALMAPGGLLSISLPFMWRALPILLYPRFGTVYPYMAWASVSKMRQEDAFYQAFFRDFVAQMALGFQYGRSPKMSMPTKLSDDLLRQVQAPCLLLLGE